ncbi:hypothetical protein CDD82_3056 [Ophiocordyceps australis]|uniref:Secreted protein n=1 Tax=Ophiocordyceps australis TaxID=1399860 RepID=A0A2C5XTK4_9HYPO|nr:hypothetical protein CDD82_3056 [Ophiocordyceps australis]
MHAALIRAITVASMGVGVVVCQQEHVSPVQLTRPSALPASVSCNAVMIVSHHLSLAKRLDHGPLASPKPIVHRHVHLLWPLQSASAPSSSRRCRCRRRRRPPRPRPLAPRRRLAIQQNRPEAQTDQSNGPRGAELATLKRRPPQPPMPPSIPLA